MRACSAPRKSARGTGDYLITLTLVDPTCKEGISINLFVNDQDNSNKSHTTTTAAASTTTTHNNASKKSKLEELQELEVGDIIRFHRLKVNLFGTKIQGINTGNLALYIYIL